MNEHLKYIITMILLFCISFVGGCVCMDIKTAEAGYLSDVGKQKQQEREAKYRMELVQYDKENFSIYKDKQTGVMYLLWNRTAGYGGEAAICVMVDAEGKPLTK